MKRRRGRRRRGRRKKKRKKRSRRRRREEKDTERERPRSRKSQRDTDNKRLRPKADILLGMAALKTHLGQGVPSEAGGLREGSGYPHGHQCQQPLCLMQNRVRVREASSVPQAWRPASTQLPCQFLVHALCGKKRTGGQRRGRESNLGLFSSLYPLSQPSKGSLELITSSILLLTIPASVPACALRTPICFPTPAPVLLGASSQVVPGPSHFRCPRLASVSSLRQSLILSVPILG